MRIDMPTGKRSWPLLSVTAAAAITAGISYGRSGNTAVGAILLTIGSISFGSWLVTEIIWLLSHTSDDRMPKDGQSSTGQNGNNSVSQDG